MYVQGIDATRNDTKHSDAAKYCMCHRKQETCRYLARSLAPGELKGCRPPTGGEVLRKSHHSVYSENEANLSEHAGCRKISTGRTKTEG